MALEFGPLRTGIGLGILRLGGQHSMEPLAYRCVFNPHLVEELQHLLIEFCLADAHSRMSGLGVASATIVNVGA